MFGFLKREPYSWERFYNLLEKIYSAGRLPKGLEKEAKKVVKWIWEIANQQGISPDRLFMLKEAHFAITRGYSFPKDIWIGLREPERKILAEKISSQEIELERYQIQHLLEDLYAEDYVILITEEVIPEPLREFKEKMLSIFVSEEIPDSTKTEVKSIIDMLSEQYRGNPNINQFLKDAEKSVFPTKRQRIRGIERFKKAWKFLVYGFQLDTIQTEIHDIIVSDVFKVISCSVDEYCVGLRIEPWNDACNKCKALAQRDWGYGKGVIPVNEFPLPLPHRGCRCFTTKIVGGR